MKNTPIWADENEIPFTQARTKAAPVRDPLPPFINADVLMKDATIVPPPTIIEGLLHRESKMILGAASKSRKTWLLLWLGIAVANGDEWCGFQTFPGKVLYIDLEIGVPFVKTRLMKIAEAMKGPKLDNLDIWSLRGNGPTIESMIRELFQRVEKGGYSMIIVDPIYKLLGGRDENKAGDIALLCNELERMAAKTGAAVVFAGHFSKGNQSQKYSTDRISGSGVFSRDADAIMTLTRHTEENCFTAEFTVRNFQEIKARVLELQFPLMIVRTDLDPKDLDRGGPPSSEHLRLMLEILPDEGLKAVVWQKLALTHGISKASFYRAKKKMIKMGAVTLVGDNWTPTRKGLEE